MRVQKTVGSSTTTYVYDAFGNLAAEYSNQAAAPSPCGTQTCYLTVDHLGSTRLLTDSAGSSSTLKRYDYLPFGEELLSGVNGRSTTQGYLASPDVLFEKYTGQVRDTETGIDWMHARFYSGPQGRFQSADPANAGVDIMHPQTWNAYAYVGNNPMTYRDPTGMFTGAGTATGTVVAPGVGTAIGLGVDIGLALYGLFDGLFGGGHPAPHPPTTPGTVGPPPGFIFPPDLGSALQPGSSPKVKVNASILACASEYASAWSIAGALYKLGAPKDGAAGFFIEALGGNSVSGVVDLGRMIAGDSEHGPAWAGGQIMVAGPRLGLPIESLPKGPADLATDAAVEKGYGLARQVAGRALGVGERIQTLTGAQTLGWTTSLPQVAKVAKAFGGYKFLYDAGAYGISLGYCKLTR